MSDTVYDERQRKWLRWDTRRNRWRPSYPWWRRTAFSLAVALLAGAATGQYRVVQTWSPLQRAYIISYGWSALALRIGWDQGSYRLLWIRERTAHHLALDADVARLQTPVETGELRLSDAARQAGGRRLEWSAGRYPHALIYGFLRHGIYQNAGFGRLLAPGLGGAVLVLMAAVLGWVAPPIGRWLMAWWTRRRASHLRATLAPAEPSPSASATPAEIREPVSGALPTTSPAITPVRRSEPSPTTRRQPPTPFFE